MNDFEELVLKAAKQNCDRDHRVSIELPCSIPGCIGRESDPEWEELMEDEKEIYLREARILLEKTGENYLPDYEDHEHIVWEGWSL